MQQVTDAVTQAFIDFSSQQPDQIEALPRSGSDRVYFRIFSGSNSYIACYNLHIKENETFEQFTTHFLAKGIRVPEFLFLNKEKTVYLLEDLGEVSLLKLIEEKGHTPEIYNLFKKSLRQLAKMQIQGEEGFDYNWCITSKEFGKKAILADLMYFKYYLLDTLKIPYDKEKLMDDLEALSNYLSHTAYKHFMFRDFQSRNIMVKSNEVYFIDYQGGMNGALQYDVASLLWQAKAELPEDWKDSLLKEYINEVEKLLGQPVDRLTFETQYNGYVLIRLLQVLGAYGFRGLFERKAHFLVSIPLALRNLQWFLQHKRIGIVLPEFDRMLQEVVKEEVIRRFEPAKATPESKLTVKINSFSYRCGIPEDNTENGGGFVFDCRSIFNPGRFEEYKSKTGRDKSVQDFLEQRSKMSEYLNNVFNLVDMAVEDYLERGFDSLMVSFGCTGGQHRSVYAADALARHLKNKYGVKIELRHRVQDEKGWVN